MSPEFRFYPRQTEAWILLEPASKTDRDSAQVGIFARLKPGVTIAGAQAEVQRIYCDSSPGRESPDLEPVVYDLHSEFTFLAGRTLQTTLLIAFAAVLFVLLIACLNVANLMLARLAERQRELAVRAALGCGRYRLARQVLTESLLLASGGAVLGVGLTLAILRMFRALNPIELGVNGDVRLSWPVLAFSGLLTAATTLFFGLLPAFRASGAGEELKLASRGSVHSGQKLARVVIAVQVALSFVLLTGAGLLMSSAFRMGAEPLGFEPDGVLSRSLNLPQSRYPGLPELRVAQARLLERLESTPGLGRFAMASKIPPDVGGNQTLEVDGHPAPPNAIHNVGGDAVSPRYFELLQVPLVAGRPFDSRDTETSEPVALINQALALQYFPQQNPLGHRIRIPGGPMPWLTIAGVVGNLKHTELMNEMQWVETPILYRPLAQEPRRPVRIIVRASGTQQAVALQQTISAFDPELPVGESETVASRISARLAYPRFRASLLSLFAITALLLSAVGLHGVLSQLISRRKSEFALRRAVGAQTAHLLTLVARQGGTPVLAGLAIGLSGTLGFSRLLTSLLYDTQPTDPLVLAVVSFGLIIVSGFAMLWPARRAARIDPMIALKEE
jgi:predicted permease